jgi:hypothetical protein
MSKKSNSSSEEKAPPKEEIKREVKQEIAQAIQGGAKLISETLNPLCVVSRTTVPDTLGWHAHLHDELCLVSDGMPIVGHAGSKVCPEPGTLFLFTEAEVHGVWNFGSVVARLCSLEFRISSEVRVEFRDLFECSPERRMLKLSAGQQHRFCNTCQKSPLSRAVPALSTRPLRLSCWLCN